MSGAGVELVIVKRAHDLSEADYEQWRDLSNRLLEGLSRAHKARWARFLAWAWRVTPGEYLTWTMHRERSTPFHRRHMKIEQTFFDAQERFDEFETFRNWLKVGAGHVTWAPGPKGGIVPIPLSISYRLLGEDKMQELHVAMMHFLRTPHAQKTLWPKQKDAAVRERGVEAIMFEFNE